MDKQLECWFSVLLLVTSVVVAFSVLLLIRKTMRLHYPPALHVVGNFCLRGPKPNEALFALSKQHRYDVCLSFRGQDTRRSFVGHLHESLVTAGVKVFLDSYNIERGNEISLAIQEAIRNSAILIPIFSKKFADSHWCLDEVAYMCKANGVIMPLFYDVKPTEVRNPRIGAYAEAFKGKKQRYTQERINEWESALQKVSSFHGWSRDDISRSDPELIKLVVKEVSEKLVQNATPVTLLQHLEEDSPDATFDPNMNENGRFVYELQGLSKEDALQHFSCHAFMRNQPEEGYKELSCKAVDICDGLPFSLEVLGAHLYNKDLSHWKHVIQTLECSSYHGRYAILRLCYDGLNSEQKEMLLDMACLFIGRRESVISFREVSHLYPNVGLTEMKLKSLIKLDEHERLVIHSQTRDTGRAIVADESAEPGNRSRLWKVEEVELVLMEEKGAERVRCLTYLQRDVRLQTDSFQRMCNLQLLWLDGTLVEGDYRKMPADLKWLRWENCPLKCLPCEWNMKHLVVLDLSFSKGIETLWPEPCNAEGLKNLKVLKLNYCTQLQVLQDLANHTCLIQLELCGCKILSELPESIGSLTQLKYLDLSNCCNLKYLPESLRWLSCLEKLSLHGCHKLRSLPQPIGDLNSLQHLDLHGCSLLQILPDSAYELESLCQLDMTGCKRISLGEEIGQLVHMERLILSNCAAIWKLPISIGQLNSLQYLNLNHCTSLFRLPEELGNLVCLKELVLNECYNLLELPQSIGKLSCLQTLEMEDTYSLSVLPPSFLRLTSLNNLKAGGCPLPQLVGKLSSLENMHLKSYKMSILPPTFGTLLRLRKLYLHHCPKFLELPHLPKDLIEVHIHDCLGLKKISSMSHMKRLKLLRIHNSRELVELPDFGSLQSLQELSISECRNVKRIQGLERLKSLRRVHIIGCRLAGSGSSILKPHQLIKETHCLELLSFSANGVPECLEKKMETNGDYLLYVTLDSNKKCSGIIMCIMVRFKSVISSVDIELSTLRNGEEIFNTRLVNDSKTVGGDQIFVHILHKNHPMVLMVQSGDVVRAKADRDEERMIRSGGMQLLSEGEDGKRKNLGRELTILMENYRESLAFEEEE